MNPRTYYIWTIGCQMNVADSERVAALLEGSAPAPAGTIQQADVIILNSCVVRQGAEDKVAGELGTLKGLKQRRPGAFVGLMGCMVTDATRPVLQKRFPHVDVFFNVLETRPTARAAGGAGRRPGPSMPVLSPALRRAGCGTPACPPASWTPTSPDRPVTCRSSTAAT